METVNEVLSESRQQREMSLVRSTQQDSREQIVIAELIWLFFFLLRCDWLVFKRVHLEDFFEGKLKRNVALFSCYLSPLVLIYLWFFCFIAPPAISLFSARGQGLGGIIDLSPKTKILKWPRFPQYMVWTHSHWAPPIFPPHLQSQSYYKLAAGVKVLNCHILTSCTCCIST